MLKALLDKLACLLFNHDPAEHVSYRLEYGEAVDGYAKKFCLQCGKRLD